MKLGLKLQGLQAPERGRDDIKAKPWDQAGQLERDMPSMPARKVC